MDTSDNQEFVFQEKDKLPYPIRQLVCTMEEILIIKYPKIPSSTVFELVKNPVLGEIVPLLIGYQSHICGRDISHNRTLHQWLKISPSQIPSPADIMMMLQQPHILETLSKYGLITNSLPKLILDIESPSVERYQLHGLENSCTFDGDVREVHMITTKGILQAQLQIEILAQLTTCKNLYHCKFSFGRPGSINKSPSVALPFRRPVDFNMLIYNVRGARSLSFHVHLAHIFKNKKPPLLAITDTRLSVGEAQEMATRYNYRQVRAIEPSNYIGGVWVFSDLSDFSLETKVNDKNEMCLNFLRVRY